MQIRKDVGKQNYDESYLRYVTLLAKIKNETSLGPSMNLHSPFPDAAAVWRDNFGRLAGGKFFG